MSVGDLLVQGMSGLGGQGSSQAAQGGPSSPGGPTAQGGGGGMPPAQIYGPDQSVGASIQQLMQMHEQDRRANGIDRGLAMMAGSFGPLETRGAIMNSAQPQDDRITAMGGAIRDESGLIELQQQQKMMELANSGQLGQMIGLTGGQGAEGTGASGTGTGAGTGGGVNIDPRILAALPPEQRNQFIMDRLKAASTLQTQPQLDVRTEAAKDLTAVKSNFGPVDSKLAALEESADWLNDPAHIQAVINAVKDSPIRTGDYGQYIPTVLGGESQDTLDARTKLNMLMNQEYASNLGANGQRIAAQEMTRLGQAATSLASRAQSPEMIQQETQRLVDQARRARANIWAASGKTLDATHSGYADPSYFNQSDPFYSGASVVKGGSAPGTFGAGATPQPAVSTGSGAPPAAGFDYSKIPSGSVYLAPDGKYHRKS